MKIANRLGLVLAVTAAVVGVRVLADFRAEMRRQYARIAAGSRMVETRYGPVEVAEAGNGPPLLVVHGTGGGFDQGMDMGADLAARGLRIISPSRFGYLRTGYPEDASAQAQADQFACLLDALGVQRAAVMGVSAGANSALQFAIRHPERTSALILLVPAAYGATTLPGSTRESSPLRDWALMRIVGSDLLYWFANRYAHERVVNMVLATPTADYQAAGADERERADRILSEILPISARAQGMLNDARLAGNPPRYALEEIRAPTLIFSVRNDLYGTYAAAQYAAAHITGARFTGYEHGGHIWLGHHDDIVEKSVAFVSAEYH